MRAIVASAHCALTCALVANGIALSLTPAVAACQYANAVALAAQFYWSWDAMFVVRAVVSAVRAAVLVRAASCGRLRACDPRPWSGDDVRLPLRAVHALAAVRMVANGYSLLAQYAEAGGATEAHGHRQLRIRAKIRLCGVPIHLARAVLKMSLLDGTAYEREDLEIAANFVRGLVLDPIAAGSLLRQYWTSGVVRRPPPSDGGSLNVT